MKIDSITKLIIPAFLAILFLILGIYLMPLINPYFIGPPKITRSQAQNIVDEFIEKQGFDLTDFYRDSFFIQDMTGIDYLTRNIGFQEVIDIANREQVPLSHWRFQYYRNVPRDNQQEIFNFRVSPSGKLYSFQHIFPDSVSGADLNESEATDVAYGFLNRWQGLTFQQYELERSTNVNKQNRTDNYLYFKRTHENLADGHEEVLVQITSGQVVGIIPYYKEPDTFVDQSGVVGGTNILLNGISVIFYVIILIIAVVVFLKRYHEGVISVRRGIIAGAAFLGLFVFMIINSWHYSSFGTSIGPISFYYTKFILFGVQILTVGVTIFISIVSCWSIGFYNFRSYKPRLLEGLGSIIYRKWNTRNFGREVPIGFLSGLILFGIIQLLYFGIMSLFGVQPRLTNSSLAFFSDQQILFSILSNALFFILFDEIIFRLFLISHLNRMMKSTQAIIVSGLVYGVVCLFFDSTFSLSPSFYSLVPFTALGIFQGIIFWRYGLLASMTSGALYTILVRMGPLFATDVSHFTITSFIIIFLSLSIFVIGLIALKKGKRYEFIAEEEPPHIRRIKERTRMQKELEIAKKVQFSLLPKEKPKLSGFDIAGVCLPALEVGGDYFDFIQLKDDKIGIAIGDVSGKGVPAAIYMTLTKGILQSHAEVVLSPKEVLNKVNSLMYRSMERNYFVSMFYAVLDGKKKTLQYARAGHNPAIVVRKENKMTELLQTDGIGLGLEVGEIFEKTLVEGELALSHGDTLIFYTDGFTEAMNEDNEEYGDSRFLELLQAHNGSTAEELLDYAVSNINGFAGEAPQHDDMTMVVLKVD